METPVFGWRQSIVNESVVKGAGGLGLVTQQRVLKKVSYLLSFCGDFGVAFCGPDTPNASRPGFKVCGGIWF